MYITQESPDQPEVIALITELDAYQDTLYPADARYALDLASLKKSNVIFVVARDGEGIAVGCGAVVITDSVGELKRVYVRPESRSQGVARSVLIELETSSSRAGCDELLLDSGKGMARAMLFFCAPSGNQGNNSLWKHAIMQLLKTRSSVLRKVFT
jgi:putative acetyltransferase